LNIKSYKINEVRHCKEASLISATILDELVNIISEGMTTQEIDNYCLKELKN
jgi:methionine aminopeptidase